MDSQQDPRAVTTRARQGLMSFVPISPPCSSEGCTRAVLRCWGDIAALHRLAMSCSMSIL